MCRFPLTLVAATFLALSAAAAEDGTIDRIVVEKSQRRMELLSDGHVVRSYDIALGFEPDGDKEREGDGRTPEGTYVIEGRNASSSFHRSLKISYPNEADRAAATDRGVSPGGDIFIHGAPNWWLLPGQPPGDWTRGCIAVTKPEIEEIWRLVADGTPIDIRP
jgi:murein L,D-transpeptidase YafK